MILLLMMIIIKVTFVKRYFHFKYSKAIYYV